MTSLSMDQTNAEVFIVLYAHYVQAAFQSGWYGTDGGRQPVTVLLLIQLPLHSSLPQKN